ncbi:hypothetical protein [Streptomyces roseifaciens]|uniref:hypothetical protein n=1 Tax=Streptomyces roseifaciens TaxID=1488406 RepID=UPI00071804C2|nr:hypothetical protein [Streptomyces roseifaciens]
MSEPDAPLLDYAIISEPFPLYAATGTDDPATALHLVVSNGGGDTVYCREIVFSLPEGDLAQSLVEADAGDGQAPDWTVTRIEPGTQTILPPGDYAHFVAKPNKADSAVDVSGITITLENLKISSRPGTARIEIREVATTSTDKWPDSPRFTKLALTKFPAPKIPVMAVSDFTADNLEVEAGTTVHLTWNGPTTLQYKVTYGGNTYPADKREYSATIDRDTTFQLSYITPDKTTHYQTTTVTVKNPKVTGLEVDGNATVTGSTDVQGLTAVKGITAKDTVTVDKILASNGTLTVDSGIAVTGAAGLQALTVNGELDAKQALVVDGALHAKGAFTASGTVDLFNGAYLKARDYLGGNQQWTYTAPTDGFMVVWLESLTSEADANVKENTAYWEADISVSGGASYSVSIPQAYYRPGAPAKNSATAPVHKGETITVNIYAPKVGNGSGYYHVYWIPLGGSGQDI